MEFEKQIVINLKQKYFNILKKIYFKTIHTPYLCNRDICKSQKCLKINSCPNCYVDLSVPAYRQFHNCKAFGGPLIPRYNIHRY